MMTDFGSIARTVRHLAAQTAVNDLELVIVTTPEQAGAADWEKLEPFGGWQVVTIPRFDSAAQGWAAGVRHARAPWAVLCEDHSFPEPHWAEALIDEHSEEWAAVAPRVENANPATAVSWANFLLCFLDWYRPEGSTQVPSGPGHNTCYRIKALEPYRDSLEEWFNPEAVLHLDMQSRGLKIRQSARAATHHVNISLAGSYLSHSFYGGRLFGGSRASHWPRVKAWVYACAFPLVPAVRLRRILAHLNTAGRRREARLMSALGWIVCGLFCHAAGEAVGYLFGAGEAMRKYMSFETRRRDHVVAGDIPILNDGQYQSAAPVR